VSQARMSGGIGTVRMRFFECVCRFANPSRQVVPLLRVIGPPAFDDEPRIHVDGAPKRPSKGLTGF
jgi:hypothetical protein